MKNTEEKNIPLWVKISLFGARTESSAKKSRIYQFLLAFVCLWVSWGSSDYYWPGALLIIAGVLLINTTSFFQAALSWMNENNRWE